MNNHWEKTMYKTFGKILGGPPKKKRKLTISQILIFQTKQFTRLLEFLKLYKQNPSKKLIYFFAIYPN